MSKKSLSASWYRLARFVCWLFCVVYFRVHVQGRRNVPESGALILAGNHQSFLDPVFCGTSVKRRLTYVARDSLWRFGPFGRLIGSVNAIPIGRDKADIAAMRMIIDRLRQGEAVCLYPEGTRTLDGRIAEIKLGFGLLCRRSQAAVIPVLVDGGFECWPRHRKLPSPGTITVWFGEILPADRVLTMTNEELADYLSRALRQMQHECRLQQGKKPYDYSES